MPLSISMSPRCGLAPRICSWSWTRPSRLMPEMSKSVCGGMRGEGVDGAGPVDGRSWKVASQRRSAIHHRRFLTIREQRLFLVGAFGIAPAARGRAATRFAFAAFKDLLAHVLRGRLDFLHLFA